MGFVQNRARGLMWTRKTSYPQGEGRGDSTSDPRSSRIRRRTNHSESLDQRSWGHALANEIPWQHR
jgi:hypothetical protein